MGLAYFLYVAREAEKTAEKIKFNLFPLWKMSNEKFKVDEAYEVAILRPVRSLSNFLVVFVEKNLIDGIVRGTAMLTYQSGVFLKLIRPQAIEQNLLYVIIGVTLFMTFIFSSFSK